MQAHHSLVPVLAILAGACAADDPESALVALVDDAERAAESRDTGFFRGLIAESYVDDHGFDRDGLIDLIRGYFLANQTVEVITRIERIELSGSDAAELTVLAGILGRHPAEGLLEGFDGHMYRLELELVRPAGDWRLIGAGWERSAGSVIGE